MSVSGSFKTMMIGQITDSMLGHLQIHKRGYVASIDSSPLTMNLKSKETERLYNMLDELTEVEAYSQRIIRRH